MALSSRKSLKGRRGQDPTSCHVLFTQDLYKKESTENVNPKLKRIFSPFEMLYHGYSSPQQSIEDYSLVIFASKEWVFLLIMSLFTNFEYRWYMS